MHLIESQSYSNSDHRIELYRRDVSTLSSKNNMQTATLKTSEVAPNARVIRIWRPPAANRPQRRHVVPPAAVYKPPSKWTVVAAFVLSVVLHAGAVLLVEMQQERPPVEVGAPVLIHSMEG
jgi:hypothetical protein